jgi:hypothetical protein
MEFHKTHVGGIWGMDGIRVGYYRKEDGRYACASFLNWNLKL